MPCDFIRSRGIEVLSPGKQKKRYSWTVLVPKAYCILIGGIMLYVNKLWANMRGSKGGWECYGWEWGGKKGRGVPALWSQVTGINSDQHPHINLILSELQDPLINEPPPVTRSWIINKTWRWGLESFIKEEKQLKWGERRQRACREVERHTMFTQRLYYTYTSRQIYSNRAGHTN